MEDIYNHKNKFNNRFEKLKTAETLRVGTGENAQNISLNQNNRDLVIKWINHRKAELQNVNGYDKDAQSRYYKTLYKELSTYMTNVLYWFNHKNLQDLTEEDIKTLYKGLEEGTQDTIKGNKNLSYKTRKDYYGRVFKGGFFKFIGKDKMAREVIKRKFTEASEVRFFDLDTLKIITDNSATNSQRLAFWLLFDTGIEVIALCQLTKANFEWIQDEKDSYFMLHIPKEISKKSRKKRDIYIHFNETNDLLKTHLKPLNDNDRILNFKPPALYHALKLVVDKYDLKTKPENKPITIKDFRSSMATYFLSQEYTTDFVKQRLGHAPSSTEIDRYVNYLGISQKKQRKKSQEITLKETKEELEKIKEKYRSLMDLSKSQQKEIDILNGKWKQLTRRFKEEERYVELFMDNLLHSKTEDALKNLQEMRKAARTFKPVDLNTEIEEVPLFDEKEESK